MDRNGDSRMSGMDAKNDGSVARPEYLRWRLPKECIRPVTTNHEDHAWERSDEEMAILAPQAEPSISSTITDVEPQAHDSIPPVEPDRYSTSQEIELSSSLKTFPTHERWANCRLLKYTTTGIHTAGDREGTFAWLDLDHDNQHDALSKTVAAVTGIQPQHQQIWLQIERPNQLVFEKDGVTMPGKLEPKIFIAESSDHTSTSGMSEKISEKHFGSPEHTTHSGMSENYFDSPDSEMSEEFSKAPDDTSNSEINERVDQLGRVMVDDSYDSDYDYFVNDDEMDSEDDDSIHRYLLRCLFGVLVFGAGPTIFYPESILLLVVQRESGA
ncbi:hypothetical protein BJ508DRAFT_303569 [Ascobolus immersus RN42]|uniref:Uncharacterized protein n=1 Tax=Ascobolus immersus RN42 TaxID=1160509 RepID=A0A3N4IJD5_ASCIM|nr:hypothetical protein BJ508DRAFT_303569 [Ascobolus immersus RN42]